VSSYIYGKSVSLDGSTNEPAQDGALTAEPKSPDLNRHQTFRLTEAEKDRLTLLSQEKGVSISTLLRSFITAAS
jgi:hypothetical protein